MKTIADLHIHSRFSMATSKEGTPERDFSDWNRGLHTSGMERRTEGETCFRGKRPVSSQR